MSLVITPVNMASFIFILSILLAFAFFDLKERKVQNTYTLGAGIIGTSLVIVTGHVFLIPLLHLTGLSISFTMGIVLYKLGSIGGADFKTILIQAIVSPGIEFSGSTDFLFLGVLGALVPILCMLMGGYLYSHWQKKVTPESPKISPLLVFLVVGYLFLQLLVFVL